MKYKIRLERIGSYFRAASPDVPCSAVGNDKDEALKKMRGEILFYLQSCPCDQIPEFAVELDVFPDHRDSFKHAA